MESFIDFFSLASSVLDGGPRLQLPPEWEQLACFISISFWGIGDFGPFGLGSGSGRDSLESLASPGIFVRAAIQTDMTWRRIDLCAFHNDTWCAPLGPRACSCRMNS